MPHSVHVTFDVHSQSFPPDTQSPPSYSVTMDAPDSSPVEVDYAGPYEADFPAVVAGHWTVCVNMVQANGTHLGVVAMTDVRVPSDEVQLDDPIPVHLTVGA